jgi:hypothetical protein
MLATVGNEYEKFSTFWWANDNYHLPPASIPFLVMGCLVGTGIGYSGWWCRNVVSATSFTLIGGKCCAVFVVANTVLVCLTGSSYSFLDLQ